LETVATVLYARLRNVLPLCNAMAPERGAELADALRKVLEAPIARHNGVVAQMRPDSVLAVFANDSEDRPDHARRALHAALLTVYQAAELNQRIAGWQLDEALPPLSIAAGVHIGTIEVAPARSGNSGQVRAQGDAVEIARVLECTAPDVGWSVVASGAARRAAGERIESGRFGSVALPDSSFVDIVEITGLAPQKTSRTPAVVYQALRDSVAQNQRQYDRPQDPASAAARPTRGHSHFAIEGYRIVRKIGEGGMASIFLAGTGPVDELQVLKVMPIAGSDQGDTLQRFLQEFALLAQVQHPNVATIYRQGFCPGHAYIAMEYFSHGDLRSRISAGMGVQAALGYARQIAAALQAIHRAGIVHRDLKPDNLMLRADGSLALADFGIAKHVSMLITDTAHGEVVGTPYYLSPEQATAQPVDQRCDLYSLGVILYEMLTGAKPYRAQTAEELLELHVRGPVPLLRPPYERLQPVLNKLMAKDREQRYADAGEFLAHLETVAP
jgi:serine/threonine-protein kinase PpkA